MCLLPGALKVRNMTKSVELPERFKNARFEALPESIQKCITDVRKTRRGIYLWGPIGTGKTYAAYAIKKQLMEEQGINTRLLSAPEMFDLIRDDFKNKDTFNRERIMSNRGILIIDDLGVEKPSEWVSETIFKIIDKRYREMIPTIITSNLQLGELSEHLGDRVASRITEMCDVIKLDGSDRRLL